MVGPVPLRVGSVEVGRAKRKWNLKREVQQEREIITIFAPAGTAAKIMDEVNRNHGVMSDANGIVMALPVDKAYKI